MSGSAYVSFSVAGLTVFLKSMVNLHLSPDQTTLTGDRTFGLVSDLLMYPACSSSAIFGVSHLSCSPEMRWFGNDLNDVPLGRSVKDWYEVIGFVSGVENGDGVGGGDG
jgi:hypothetical protein